MIEDYTGLDDQIDDKISVSDISLRPKCSFLTDSRDTRRKKSALTELSVAEMVVVHILAG